VADLPFIVNHIPHPPHSASTSGTTTTAPAETQPSDTNNTAEGEQSADVPVILPPVTDNAPVSELSDTRNVVDATEAQERVPSPERPSPSASAAPEGESMDVDAPVGTTTEVRLSLLSVLPGARAENGDHEMDNTSAPEPELESPENSIPSNSSGISRLVADGNGVSNGALDGGGEYSEKVISPLGGDGDVHMVIHDESEPPITSSSARVA
jgi:hypothetical protein